MNKQANIVIDALGGTAKVARICEITMPRVSNWRKDDIPSAHIRFFKAAYKSKLHSIDLEAATSKPGLELTQGLLMRDPFFVK